MSQSILDRVPPPADTRVRFGKDPLHFADLRLPRQELGPHPCVIAVHGGFWRNTYGLDHLGHLCAALTEQGLSTWNIEYRRLGDRGGGWPGTFHDITTAAMYLTDHASDFGVDPNRVSVLGHSAGGHLASWLASMANVPVQSLICGRPLKLRGAVSLAGVLDLRQAFVENLSNGAVVELLGGRPNQVPERYAAAAPIALVPSAIPHLIVHGRNDDIVPSTISEAYHAAAISAGASASLLLLSDADHFDVIDPMSPMWSDIAAAIVELATV